MLAESPSGLFPAEAINARLAQLNRAVRFTDEEIEALLDLEYGDRRAFLLLSLAYPRFDYSNAFHIDHIYPRAKMTERRLTAQGLTADEARDAVWLRDTVPNLQLLQGPDNKKKSDFDFEKWMERTFPSRKDRGYFLAMHHFPQLPEFTYPAFPKFHQARRERLTVILRQELNSDVHN